MFMQQPEDELLQAGLGAVPPMPAPPVAAADPSKGQQIIGRAQNSPFFQTEAGPAEQAYLSSLQEPAPTYEIPPMPTGAKRVGAEALNMLRPTRDLGQRMLYGERGRRQEKFGYESAMRNQKTSDLGKAAALEVSRQNAANTALFRSATLNYQGARNVREEKMVLPRIKMLESQAKSFEKRGERDVNIGKAAIARANRSPAASTRVFNPGQGIIQDGKVIREPDVETYRRGRQTAGRTGAGKTFEIQLVGVERDKDAKLDRWENERRKTEAQIKADNFGISPKLPDGSRNPRYDLDYRMNELEAENKSRKAMIQRNYQEQLKRLHQNVGEQEVDTEDLNEPELEPEGDEMGGDAEAMEADALDQMDTEAPGAEDETPELPIGVIYHNPETGEKIMWDGEKWVPAP